MKLIKKIKIKIKHAHDVSHPSNAQRMCFKLSSLSVRTLKDFDWLLRMAKKYIYLTFFFFTFKGSDTPLSPTSGHGLNFRCALGTKWRITQQIKSKLNSFQYTKSINSKSHQ